ncbi:hypothetical protein NIES2101_27500 [Calothrix sp. HK-06]|nr:hypothetical protein NIES2101_27500 [Calothrix sp. HK-06]
MLSSLKIPGYNITEVIYEGLNTLVYRGLSQSHQPVILKILKAEYPTLEQITRLRHEYTITENLDLDNVVKVYGLESYQNRLVLVAEDFDGISLKQYLTRTKLPLITILSIVVQLAQALVSLHTHCIIHKDIKPANIIINAQTKQVKLADFSIASKLSKETPSLSNAHQLEGTLTYMSPEQTGRMNRDLDYRTDFYSLGITFYEMLTGQLPFKDVQDPMELVHCHIAQIPLAPNKLNPNVPDIISEIVMKLLAKTAEERYQSAYGLKADLEVCIRQLETTGEIVPFPLSQRDWSNQLQIPQKLYGREAEVATLMSAFTNVSLGGAQMMLVAGYSGIGKSSLVNEIHRPITRQRGYFISGKFDQFKRNIPFASLIQAFVELVRQFLAESDAKIQDWRQKLLNALGNNGQIIIDVIPEVELIIGKQPFVSPLAPVEAQMRFNLVFKQFIHVFANKEHPLVIFLDDLQWADAASLKLIQLLMTDSETQYLLLIAAYRDNEVNNTHPFILIVEDIRGAGAKVEEITLQALSISHITELLIDTLKSFSTEIEPLANLLYNKAQGNPFFINQLIKSLYQDSLLNFNINNCTWSWDINQIENRDITDNVVDLMIAKIQKLPQSTRQILKLASCINNCFDLNTLAVVSQQSLTQTATDLWSALLAGLVVPLNNNYKIPLVWQQFDLETFSQTAVQVDYKFLHDRVQQAAYTLIPASEKQRVHLQVGQVLLRNTKSSELEEKIFDIVNHLNLAQTLITAPSEYYQLAELNLLAGKRAKSSSAFETALKLLKIGIICLPFDSWLTHYSLTLELYLETGVTEYLNGNNDAGLAVLDVALDNVKTRLERCQVNEYKIMCYRMKNNLIPAYEVGLNTLQMLGIEFEAYPNKDYLLKEYQVTKAIINVRDVASLALLPEMQDPEKLMAQRTLKEVWPIAYFLGSKALHLCAKKITQLSINYGNSPISVFGYMLYSFTLVFRYGEAELGYEFGNLALKLHGVLQTKDLEANLFNMWGGLILHYKKHISQCKPYLKQGFSSGLETGSYQWSGYCSVNYIWQCLFGDKSLQETAAIADNFISTLQRIDKNMLNYHLLAKELITNLVEPDVIRQNLSNKYIDEHQVLEFAHNSADLLTIFVVYLYKLTLCNWCGEYTKAVEYAELAEQCVEGAEGIFINPVFYFHQSIALSNADKDAESENQESFKSKLSVNLEKFSHWAKHCPENYQHMYLLLQAEEAKISGQDYQAMELYDQAITLATEAGFRQNEALATELTAKFYFAKGRNQLATDYLLQSHYCYTAWGAKNKVKQLEEKYNQFLAVKINNQAKTDIIRTVSTTTGISLLDLHTVIKASQTLSSEINLPSLLNKLIIILQENAGAQKACLVSKRESNWIIEVATNEFNDVSNLPLSVLNYVERTQKNIILENASHSKVFVNDPYIIKNQPKSVLCLPIIHQGKLTGIIYLENNLTTGVFTADRLEILNLLSSQVSISIENARLYALEQDKAQQLQESLEKLSSTQAQLVHTEKISSLGQLVAGVAHEVNNPVSFINGNLTHAQQYIEDLIHHLELYQQHFSEVPPEILEDAETVDLKYLLEDLPKMISSMKLGTVRIKDIMQSLRNFSRNDGDVCCVVDIHEGIETTLMILSHRLKAKPECPAIKIIKNYGDLPHVECYPQQLNQVFMNLIANAIDALEEANQGKSYKTINNIITIYTTYQDGWITMSIGDNGLGMTEAVQQKLFNAFFTTKPQGKGTGLGLSISYQIVTQKHSGTLECISAPGEGTQFIISIPVILSKSS